jgi:hypothetical protein
MMIRPTVNGRRAQTDPRFGNMTATAPMALRMYDFLSPGKTLVGMNKLIYAAVIGSRILYSRSPNERMENARRDILGWYSWFMGSPLMQTALVLCMFPLVSKLYKGSQMAASKNLMLTHLDKSANPLKKALWGLFAPDKLWLIATDKQLHQRKTHIINGMKEQAIKHSGRIDKVTLDRIAKVQNLFGKTINYRALVSFIGLAFTFFALGIGINLVNIALTRNDLQKKHESSNQPSKSVQPMFQSKLKVEGLNSYPVGISRQNPFVNNAYQTAYYANPMNANPYFRSH